MQEREPILAFIHVAKTGGRSVETMLRSTFAHRYVHAEQWISRDPEKTVQKYREDDFRRLKRYCPFMRAVGGHSITLWSGIDQVQPVRWFAFLRDPVKRAASHYQFHQRHTRDPKTWEEWIRWDVPRNHQLRAFVPSDNPAEAIAAIKQKKVFVGLLEHFDESLLLLQKLVAPELNLAYHRTNTASDNQIASDLLSNTQKREQLTRLHAGEFELYEFVRSQLYPSFREEYGPSLAKDLAAFKASDGCGVNRWNDRLHRASRKFYLGPVGMFYRSLRKPLTSS